MVTTLPHTEALTDSRKSFKTRLLVSVRTLDEAKLALRCGVDWLDVKEPNYGSLGCPSLDVALSIERLVERSGKSVPFSVALGELIDSDVSQLVEFTSRFCSNTFFKVALRGGIHHSNWRDELKSLAQSLGQPTRLIPVFYADHRQSESPLWQNILNASVQIGARHALIDTFDKRAGCLLDSLSTSELARMCEEAHKAGLHLALAGSIRQNHLGELFDVGCDLIGVRGAVCMKGNRTDELDEMALRKLQNQFSEWSFDSNN